MNCQDIGKILNDDDIGALSPAIVNSAREHLATCDECAADWNAHERMLAMPMPVPGPGLLAWRPVNRGVVAAAPSRRPFRGSLIVGTLIAVGAAAAVFVAVEQAQSLRTTESPATGATSDAASTQDEAVGAAADSSEASTDEPDPSAIRASRPGYPYAFTAVLLPSRHEQQDEETVGTFEAALLDKVRSMPHLILIEPESFDEYLRPNGLPRWPLPEGIDFAFQLHRPPWTDIGAPTGHWSIRVYVLNAGDNRIALGGASVPSDSPLSIGEARAAIDDMFETQFRRTFPPEDLSRLAEIRDTALDSNRSEQERFAVLEELSLFPRRFIVFDERVQREVGRSIALIATEIVANSPDPAVRVQIWDVVSGLKDPYLVAPLAESLQRDPADVVRIAAARLLSLDFGSDPVTRAALDSAALNDASRAIRNFARWANANEADRRALLVDWLSDPEVRESERLAVVRSSVPRFQDYITRESAELLLGIEPSAFQDIYWSAIISEIANAPSPEVVPLLLERLRVDPDAAMRRVAAGALLGHQDEPGVVEALRYARDNDPSLEVRLAAFTVR